MENLERLKNTFAGKSIWISGVTGFKGSWLAEWLLSWGAKIFGFSLPPPTNPSLFDQLNLTSRIHLEIGDVRHPDQVKNSIAACRPDFVFHLAAQPLVRLSYNIPRDTWETNVTGTIHVLEALRSLSHPCAAILITTDKVYENKEWLHAYRECDPLGGLDPYSSSKAAAEIAIHSWRHSFFPPSHPVKIASARAGNVIGGGDWALDRIVPDAIRALSRSQAIPVRNPHSTRPWQHVLEPLSGYLVLAERLSQFHQDPQTTPANTQNNPQTFDTFNFGPNLDSNRPVLHLVKEILKHWPGSWEDHSNPNAPHEASKLNLATDKAFHLLGWQPRWNFTTTIKKTIDWYQSVHHGANPVEITQKQIAEYSSNDL